MFARLHFIVRFNAPLVGNTCYDCSVSLSIISRVAHLGAQAALFPGK
jgi:hypothetical protein